jgi:hypothetical protein
MSISHPFKYNVQRPLSPWLIFKHVLLLYGFSYRSIGYLPIYTNTNPYSHVSISLIVKLLTKQTLTLLPSQVLLNCLNQNILVYLMFTTVKLGRDI